MKTALRTMLAVCLMLVSAGYSQTCNTTTNLALSRCAQDGAVTYSPSLNNNWLLVDNFLSGVSALPAAIKFGGGLTASGAIANDFSGSTGAFKTSTGANTIGGRATFTASTTGGSALNIPPGIAPTSTVSQDLWTDSTQLNLGYAPQTGAKYFASWTVGAYQGTASTSITTGNFTVLTGPAIKLVAGTANAVGKHIHVKVEGVYTTAAASVLNADFAICTVSGCGSGTVVAPAGCVVVGTNQANVLANGQFVADCDLIIASAGASGTAMAKATAGFNLGAAASGVVLSYFPDTATAVSAAIDWTVDEFIHPRFKFTTSNASNAAVAHIVKVDITD